MTYYQVRERDTDKVVSQYAHQLDAEIALIESEREDLMVRRIEIKKPSVIAQLASWAIAAMDVWLAGKKANPFQY